MVLFKFFSIHVDFLACEISSAAALLSWLVKSHQQLLCFQKMDPWGGSHAEENALSFADAVAGDQKLREDHTKKRKKRLKGSEVVFNPEEHK